MERFIELERPTELKRSIELLGPFASTPHQSVYLIQLFEALALITHD